ncbi:glycoside hydrolase family 95 protein [Spirosoma sordidisoli]|uniref:Glycoside hydrolase family 95 protein n=1 Tax=Spirosoma sordidisoli TaxID=2502893 RepID=A0A4Q2UJU3_9BACT|nr:glycoside hydrolase family 95 protein [Spirosoma sordidisoli]RYC67730.1 glycoside hydrolase family 95 protein [Spirosoma sordidisoli]
MFRPAIVQVAPILLIVSGLLLSLSAVSQPTSPIWYKQPARNWNEALPVGNGRLGVMVFGRVAEELLQLNESSLWSGGPVNRKPNPGAAAYLPQVREALFREDYAEAARLTTKLQGLYTEAYQPLGDLRLKQTLTGEPTAYTRELNIDDATATTRFTINGVTYSRTVFVSAPDQLIVIRLRSSKKGALSLTASATSPHPVTKQIMARNELAVRGKAPAHSDPNYVQYNPTPVIYADTAGCRGMRFDWRINVQSTDGRVSTDTSGLRIDNATEAVLLVSAATSFNGFDKCPDRDGLDEKKLAAAYLAKATGKSADALYRAHVADYQQLANRVRFSLQADAATPPLNLPMDERLQRYAGGAADPQLESLYFQFGRYLLISSSRPKRPGNPAARAIPANLQGIWNPIVRPPWSSNYTTNINTEMNYWPAEMTNLSELHTPLLDWIGYMATTGRETTRHFYNASGWTVHHNSDIWATSNPVGDRGKGSPSWANWAMGGAWLSQHLWDHYAFTGNRAYLQQYAYPLMKEAAQFCLDWLVTDSQGRLVTAPATTPENIFVTEKGEKGSVSVATTMDMALVWDLFSNVIQASEQLNVDADFRQTLLAKKAKLFPLQIGRKGNLQEWYKDWADEDPQHRHVSHLYALHPGRELSPLTTPALADAARQTLAIRGDGGTGWSKSWKINFWARLHDGNHAYKLLRELLRLTGLEGTDYANGGGTYPNLLCAHPPFQIDGNFGGTSGIGEMLLQSHDGLLNLLPARPDAWASGEVSGLKARGGYEVAMRWQNGKLTRVAIRSSLGGLCRLRVPNALTGTANAQLRPATGSNPNPFFKLPQNQYQTRSPEQATNGVSVYDLATEAGKEYILVGKP